MSSAGRTGQGALAHAVREDLELDFVIVEPLRAGEERRFAALRAAGRHLDATAPSRIGVGWGMSLRLLPAAVPVRARPHVRVYDAIGHGAWWAIDDGPFDIAAALAARYGGSATRVGAPAYANSLDAARVYLADGRVTSALASAASADIVLVGPSTADPETSSVVLAGGMTREEMAELRARGAVGDIIGQFYGQDGGPINTPLDARSVRLSLAQLRAANVVAIATGTERTRSIVGATNCGLIKGLITDERTGAELLDYMRTRPRTGRRRSSA